MLVRLRLAKRHSCGPEDTSSRPSDTQLCPVTNTAVLRRLPSLLAVLAGVYLLLSQLYLLRLSGRDEYRSAVVAFISAGILLLLRAFVCRKLTAARWSHPLAVFVAGLVLTNVLVDMASRSDLRQTVVLLITIVSLGSAMRPARWLAFCLFASLVPWSLVAYSEFTPAEWFPYGMGLLVATSVALVFSGIRFRRHGCQSRPIFRDSQGGEARNGTERQEALAVAGADDGLWHWDLATDRVHLSTRWLSMLGYGENDIGTRLDDWFSLIHPYYLQGFRRDLEAHLSGQTDQLTSEYRIRQRDGTYRWVLCRGRAIRDKDGRPIEVAGCQTDISSLIELEKSVIHDALHDRLTGLPNRSYLMARLERVVELYCQNPANRFALIFFDLDGFKAINDTLGHLVGDQLLTAVACRLRDCRRSEDLVARFAGDEFVLLLEKLRDYSEALQVAKRVQGLLAEPFQLNGQEVLTSASIGVVLSNTGFKDAEALLRNADSAMYDAKRRDKGGIRVFGKKMTGKPVGVG